MRLTVLALVLVSTSTFITPSPPRVEAACAALPPLQKVVQTARIAFVGSVLSVSDYGSVAKVRVDNVWRGQRVPRLVKVNGRMGSESRYFKAHRRYLFFPNPTRYKWLFKDSVCTPTRPYTRGMDRLRPAGAHRL